MDEQQHDKGFRVTDRRRFTDAGASDEAGAGTPDTGASTASTPREPVTFSTFVLGLSTQALLLLGEIEGPLAGAVERDLAAAKDLIDVLGILRDKTRNNLEQAEEQLLDSILYDLRMRYVELARAPKKEGA
jgi:hypothetical protein